MEKNNFMEDNLGIGGTPLVELTALSQKYGLKTRIFAKIEGENPAGSIKDRVALKMIQDFEAQGKIEKGGTIIEATSGNTGIGLAYVCKQRGYGCIIVMPDNMSRERIDQIKSYGAEIVLTDGSLGMTGAIQKANEIQRTTPNSVIASQFENPSNPQAHYETTGPEIYQNMQTRVDFFVCGVGTGGTLTGVAKYLKEQNKGTKAIAVEPYNSAVISGEKAGPHGLQGIGAGFIPTVLDTSLIDMVIKVRDEDAFKMTREVYDIEGVMAGISSGAALHGAILLAKKMEQIIGTEIARSIVVILPDTGKRYLSMGLFD